MRGLIVRKPWIDLILQGKKKWEIRKTNTKIRGYIALLFRKKLYGFVYLKDVKKLSLEELEKHIDKHLSTKESLKTYARNRKYLYAWILENPIKLEKPIDINYPKGCQQWVRIAKKDLEKLSGELLRKLYQDLDSAGKEKSISKEKTE